MENVRYFYRTEKSPAGVERVFTIAYSHNKDSGETRYGASVFRKDRPNETFVKKNHRHTARRRLEVRPVFLKLSRGTWDDVEDQIRSAIREFGVRGIRS